jgi:hypothetical protein
MGAIMLVTKKSPISGKTHAIELPITQDQYQEWFLSNDRRMIQEVFPDLSDEQREFLLTGITPEEWAKFIEDEKESEE